MTAPEVAALLRLHVKTVYKLAETGVIPGKRIGRSWRFSRAAVLEFVVASMAKESPPRLTGILSNWPKKA